MAASFPGSLKSFGSERVDGEYIPADDMNAVRAELLAIENYLLNGSWVADAGSWSYVSADSPTGIISINANMTARLSKGMRVKYSQPQALTAYWSMDASSNSQVGSFNGADTSMTYTPGKFSNAATFNGSSSKIVLADHANLKPSGDFTLGCWFKTSAAGVLKALFQSYSANTFNAGLNLVISSGNVLKMAINKNTGTLLAVDYSEITGSTTVTDGNWHYVVASYRNNFMQLYLDGSLEAAGYCLSVGYAATNYVRIGCNNYSGTDLAFFNGQIDDLFLMNGYALDAETIRAQYQAGAAQGSSAINVAKMGIITNVGSWTGTETQITVYHGTDYGLGGTALSSPFYSAAKAPVGFPLDPDKWTVTTTDSLARIQTVPAANTWYNLGGISLAVPIGLWRVRFSGMQRASVSLGTSVSQRTTLSTSATGESSLFTVGNTLVGASGNLVLTLFIQSAEIVISRMTKASYYLNASTQLSIATIEFRGDVTLTQVRAVCAYL